MNTPKNYVIAFLLLTTIGGAAFAWQQYQELIQLRASGSLNNDERADLQKRLWASEKSKHALETSAAAHQGESSETGELVPAREAGPNRRGERGNMAANFAAMMDKPEIQKLMAIQQRAGLDERYAALFKNLNLSPAQLEQFKNLLVEKQTAVTDALQAARAQGINPRTDPEDFQKLITDAQTDADASIKSALGDAGYTQYQQYQQTLPQRNVVNQLAQSLSYTSTPLTPEQSEQMVQILAANTPASGNATGNNVRATVASAFGVGFGGAQANASISNNAIAQASSVLSATQLTALQQLQATQQARTQLNQAMRNQFRNAGTTTTSAAKTGTGGR
ncbi:MAG: hypothetical protein ABI222_09835 [Opitutaceae bacterium]